MEFSTTFDSAAFRGALGSFATGIAVATCRDATGKPVGLPIKSLTSVSLTPPLVLFCLSDRTRATPAFMAAENFALNILAAGQEYESRHFAGATGEDWSGIASHPAPEGSPPLLAGCMGWIACRKHAVHPGGDHHIIVGEVTGLGHNPIAPPLLYFRKQYRHLS